jgi:hypothetical protein
VYDRAGRSSKGTVESISATDLTLVRTFRRSRDERTFARESISRIERVDGTRDGALKGLAITLGAVFVGHRICSQECYTWSILGLVAAPLAWHTGAFVDGLTSETLFARRVSTSHSTQLRRSAQLQPGGNSAPSQITVFGGVTMPAPRPAFGVAWGKWRGPVGFEVEYGSTIGDRTPERSSIFTVGVNLLVQTPIEVGSAKLFAAGGFGASGESIGGGHGSLNSSSNFGVGLRQPLGSSLALRLDWRFFHVGSSPDGAPTRANLQRLSAGISIGF